MTLSQMDFLACHFLCLYSGTLDMSLFELVTLATDGLNDDDTDDADDDDDELTSFNNSLLLPVTLLT